MVKRPVGRDLSVLERRRECRTERERDGVREREREGGRERERVREGERGGEGGRERERGGEVLPSGVESGLLSLFLFFRFPCVQINITMCSEKTTVLYQSESNTL